MTQAGNGAAGPSFGPSAGPSVSSGKEPTFSLQEFEDLVNIPKSEYEELLKASAELDHLKMLLAEKRVKGVVQTAGVYSSSSQNNKGSDSSNSLSIPAPRRKQDYSKDEEQSPQNDSDNKPDTHYSTVGADSGAEHRGHELVGDHRRNDDSEPCTIALRIPNGATHADIINAVRGGLLMDIHLLPHRHACFVTFMNHGDAENFMAYCQSHAFYVSRRSTPVGWAGRQWWPGQYAMKRAKEGTASRNLVIYNINQRPAITEDMIRHDLYHIHNMVVIYVQFSEGNAYLSTNSVSNALYARTCMLSRTMYRGLQIGFYPDECDGDIDDMDDSAPPYTLPPVEKDAKVYNPYDVLSVEGVEDEDEGNQGSVEDNEDEELEPY